MPLRLRLPAVLAAPFRLQGAAPAAVALAVLALAWAPAVSAADSLEEALGAIERAAPASVEECTADRARQLRAASAPAEEAAAALALRSTDGAAARLRTLQTLLVAKDRVDALLERSLELRTQFAGLPQGEAQRTAIRAFLRLTSGLIDLSGRLRYVQSDALRSAMPALERDAAARAALLELLSEHQSSIGAVLLAERWFAADAPVELPAKDLGRALRVIRAARESDALPQLAALIRRADLPDWLRVDAAFTIRSVGLPQSPRPDQDPELGEAAITAAEVHELLAGVAVAELDEQRRAQHGELLAWAAERRDHGVTEEEYRFGRSVVRPGDWLLMRNPSPYNLFTDLSPGLFTHVGVVAAEDGPDGQRRFVIVDMPEAEPTIPATNVDVFLQRTLHYVFLRHPDPAAGAALGGAAASMIGNPALFDLNFQTSRVDPLAGQPLAGRTIQTYCAGFLYLCALQTGRPRSEFFPLAEGGAGGAAQTNLAQLGITFGSDFVSPTGALFSQTLQLVGRREPMYEPTREIEEGVFDYFAQALEDKTLTPAPDWFQSLRENLAEAAVDNPLLAELLAAAAGVNPEVDLVAAARTKAVVEALDAAAFGASADFLDAREIIRAGPLSAAERRTLPPEEVEYIQDCHARHAELCGDFWEGRLSPRALRRALVRYYIEQGRRELDARFFTAPPSDE